MLIHRSRRSFQFRARLPNYRLQPSSECIWVDQLTLAEKVACTPLHMQISILRLRTNNIPFCKYGQICYPLKKPLLAASLPWKDFKELPFVVMTHHDRLGTVHEAMVRMKNIERTGEFMSRLRTCPVTGKQRTYYRFYEQFPFRRENMEILARSINPDTSYPNNVRKLNESNVHERADKPIQVNELQSWFQSGYQHGSLL